MNRRGFITGLFSAAVAAPAIIRVIDLMPVKPFVDPLDQLRVRGWKRLSLPYAPLTEGVAPLPPMTDIEDYLANTTPPLGMVYRATRWDRVRLLDFS